MQNGSLTHIIKVGLGIVPLKTFSGCFYLNSFLFQLSHLNAFKFKLILIFISNFDESGSRFEVHRRGNFQTTGA